MKRHVRLGVSVAVAALVVIALNSVYVVGQTQEALVLRFGQPVAVINTPGHDDAGLRLKLPFADRAVMFDRRSQAVEADSAQIATAAPETPAPETPAPGTPASNAPDASATVSSNGLMVDALMRYRIVDPLSFYRALGDEAAAAGQLQVLLASHLRDVLGHVSSQAIVSGPRDRLMQLARAEADQAAKAAHLGVKVLDVRLLRAGPSPAGVQAVDRRMRADRQQQAVQIRTDGEQQKRAVMAGADKEAAILRGTANGQAEQIRGDAEAKRSAIFADAYGRDPQFAQFLRTMQAYREALGQGDTTLVLSPDSAFLKGVEAGPTGGK